MNYLFNTVRDYDARCGCEWWEHSKNHTTTFKSIMYDVITLAIRIYVYVVYVVIFVSFIC